MQNVLKSKMFIGALAAVAAIAATVVIALNVGHSGNDLQTQLDLGNKYVSELDYENAIIAYEEALEIDPYCLEAYFGLYDAYLALGQQDKAIEIMEQARNMLPDSVEVYVSLAQLYASQNQIGLVVSTLEEGIEVTNSDRLREMLREYQYEPEDGQTERADSSPSNETEEEEAAPVEEPEETSVAVGLRPDEQQQTVVPVLMVSREEEEIEIPLITPPTPPVQDNSTEGDSGSSGGNHGDSSSSGDTTDTRTGISGNIYDINGQGIEGVTVTVYPEQESEPIEVSTDMIGSYLQELPIGNYRVVLSKDGYAELSTFVTVSRDNLASGSYIMLTEEESRQSASIKGIVIDATDSRGIEGARMVFMKGFDQNPDENPDVLLGNVHAFTGNNGNFSVPDGMTAGYYTVQVVKDGYSTYRHNETVKPGENEFSINMSPTIQTQGVYRIVLTWGAVPSDLDSHLVCTGNDNYHVYFANKDSSDGNASLDLDDVTSYGPETITVKIGEGNSYVYAVHNFSNGGATPGQSDAWNLSSSGAKVMVYADEGLIFDGNVPVNEQGTTWEVFRIENGQLIVTNKISFDYPEMGVGGRSADEPAALSDEVGKEGLMVSDESEAGMHISGSPIETEAVTEQEQQKDEAAIESDFISDNNTAGESITENVTDAEIGDAEKLQENEPEEEIQHEEGEIEENTEFKETEVDGNSEIKENNMEDEPQPEENNADEGIASNVNESNGSVESQAVETGADGIFQESQTGEEERQQEIQTDEEKTQQEIEPEGEDGQIAEENIN